MNTFLGTTYTVWVWGEFHKADGTVKNVLSVQIVAPRSPLVLTPTETASPSGNTNIKRGIKISGFTFPRYAYLVPSKNSKLYE